MAFDWNLSWVSLLAVCAFSVAANESLIRNCSIQADQLSAALKVAGECEDLPWGSEESASILLSLTKLRDSLHKQLLKNCHGGQPEMCPEANVPKNGGLVCVTVADRRYCKPLCNYGFDFAFLRRSRPYDECSEQTKYKWNTQYVGGNTLAVCNEALLQISGAKTAYFPKNQTCLETQSNSQHQSDLIATFINELSDQHVKGEPQHACLTCGEQ